MAVSEEERKAGLRRALAMRDGLYPRFDLPYFVTSEENCEEIAARMKKADGEGETYFQDAWSEIMAELDQLDLQERQLLAESGELPPRLRGTGLVVRKHLRLMGDLLTQSNNLAKSVGMHKKDFKDYRGDDL